MYLLEDPGAWYLLKGAIYNVFEYLMYLIQFRLQFFMNIHFIYKKL